MAAFDEATIRWLTVLGGAVVVSLLSVLVPNRYHQGRNPRTHNGIKLLNECLVRHQLVYLTYFLALVMTDLLFTGGQPKRSVALRTFPLDAAYIRRSFLP